MLRPGGVGGVLVVALEPQPARMQDSGTARMASAAHARFRVVLCAAIGM
jgi:hypothetical protein